MNNGLRKLRDAMGCSQKNLAAYFGVTESTIAMAETDYRNLPEHMKDEFVRMMACQNIADQPGNRAEVYISEQKRRRKESLEKDKSLLEAKLDHFRNEWMALKNEYDIGCERLRYLSRIDLPVESEEQQRRSHILEVIGVKGIIRSEKFGLVKQAQLELEIAALEARLSVINRMISDI